MRTYRVCHVQSSHAVFMSGPPWDDTKDTVHYTTNQWGSHWVMWLLSVDLSEQLPSGQRSNPWEHDPVLEVQYDTTSPL